MTVESLAPASNIVIASVSEAIQGNEGEELDCFVASAPRNDVDGSGHTSAISRHTAPELCKFVRPKKEGAVRSQEGRREDRVRAAPAVSCARVDRKTHMSIQVQRKQSGLPCAMVLRLIFVLSPVRP
jgi:hypothetical protein